METDEQNSDIESKKVRTQLSREIENVEYKASLVVLCRITLDVEIDEKAYSFSTFNLCFQIPSPLRHPTMLVRLQHVRES